MTTEKEIKKKIKFLKKEFIEQMDDTITDFLKHCCWSTIIELQPTALYEVVSEALAELQEKYE